VSVTSFDPEDYGLVMQQETVPRNWRRELEARIEAAEQRAEQAEARAAELEDANLFAGIPTDGVGGIYRRGYEGERTVEAVQAGWAALGQPSDTQRALSGHQQAQAMASGAPPASTSNFGNDLAVEKQQARMTRNPMDFHHRRQRVIQNADQQGIEPNPLGWKLPGQLQQVR
jgi:hypothetical protein